MWEALTRFGPFAERVMIRGSGECILSRISLRFRIMSVTSSTTPTIVEYSCCTFSIRTDVIAVPWSEERRTLRRAFPSVVPNPLSRGSAMNFP